MSACSSELEGGVEQVVAKNLAEKKMILPFMDKLAFIEIALRQVGDDNSVYKMFQAKRYDKRGESFTFIAVLVLFFTRQTYLGFIPRSKSKPNTTGISYREKRTKNRNRGSMLAAISP